MLNHELFVGATALALALAVKMPRRPLALAAPRAIANLRSTGLGHEVVLLLFCAALRDGGPPCEGQWSTTPPAHFSRSQYTVAAGVAVAVLVGSRFITSDSIKL